MKVRIFLRLNFRKRTGETITWKAERVGVVTMTKKGHHLFEKTMSKNKAIGGRLLLPALDFGTVYLLTSGLPTNSLHFVGS